MKGWITSYSSTEEGLVYYQQSFSTAEIAEMLFHDEISPEYQHQEVQPSLECRLIGDELMVVDRKNFPPSANTE